MPLLRRILWAIEDKRIDLDLANMESIFVATSKGRRAVLRGTVHLLVPGISLFAALLIVSVVARSLPSLRLVGALFYGFGVIPIGFILSIAALSVLYWRHHWLSGLSLVCAVPLALAFGIFPNPVNSPVGWAANVLKVIYYHHDLQQSYAEAKNSGETLPVGQAGIDGFGSLTSGLVYDPSGEIALPPNQRSKAWTDVPGATELGIDRLEVHHIVGPYYQWFHD
jgi:hypothetical protein